MVPRDAIVSPPWEPPPKRNSLYERRTQWLGLRQGCSDASPILSYKNKAGQQDRQDRTYTVPYNIAKQGAQHRRHPPNTETTQGMVTGGRRGEAVGHRPPQGSGLEQFSLGIRRMKSQSHSDENLQLEIAMFLCFRVCRNHRAAKGGRQKRLGKKVSKNEKKVTKK